jgi:hypothetical protein
MVRVERACDVCVRHLSITFTLTKNEIAILRR